MTIIIGITLAFVIPMLLIKMFSSIDKEIGQQIKLNKKDIIIMLAFSIVYITLMPKTNTNLNQYINITLLIGYLIFMSYTDQKTKLLYSIVSILMIVIESILLFINRAQLVTNEYTWTIILIPIVLSIMSIFRFIGFGDVLIYVVLSLVALQYRKDPTLSVLINLFLANILFLIISCLIIIVTKNKEKHQPLTIFILASTFICNLFLI